MAKYSISFNSFPLQLADGKLVSVDTWGFNMFSIFDIFFHGGCDSGD